MLNRNRLVAFSIILNLVVVTFAAAEDKAAENSPDPAKLTIDRIYQNSEFDSKGFDGRWMNQGSSYLKLEDGNIVQVNAETGAVTILVEADLMADESGKRLNVERYQFSPDMSHVLLYTNSIRVWRTKSRGDYWVLDRGSRQCWQIGKWAKPSTLMFAKFSPDLGKAAYVHENDIYVEDLRSGAHLKLTTRDNPNVINGTFDWVYEEEFQIRDGFRWSPDSKSIAYWQLDTTDVPQFTMINNTDSLYPKLIRFAHPKPGQMNAACRVGVVDIQTSQTRWVSLPGDPRNNYIARMEWIESPTRIVLQQLNRLQNTNRLYSAEVNGNSQVILTEQDEAWVDVHDEMFWLGDEFTWISERDGWRHIYVSTRDGEQRLITPGSFDVIRLLKIDETSGNAYFAASPDNATESYLYQAKLDGSGVERLTPKDQPGIHRYSISADGKFAAHTYSQAGSAPMTEMIRLPSHEVVRVLQNNEELQKKLDELHLEPVEFFQVDIGQQHKLDAWCIKPPNFDKNKQYPLLIYVYGEPAGSTVKNQWGGSSYLWHAMLAQRGYVVMSFDNRGTNVPKGRDWRKSIYRRVGVIAPEDQAAAVKAVLKERAYLNSERVGIWGWSGGGSMSLNAIFKFPDVYKMAISIAPVPNQRYYDTIYQERYMGLPNDNVQGYTQGSPINFAKNLKGQLLLIHGTGDDNCHYQTMEMLINELIHHDKPFTMMAYPNRTHAIREGKNTTVHLRRLMTTFIEENL